MNPNSISHRLFAAALSQGGQTVVKRPDERVIFKSSAKFTGLKKSVTAGAARKLNEWSWSGWQHTTI